ncbi:hypothetical protein [Halobacillus salinus]|uniref:hypothetical protein n=1 Tax=Halobacillus salinus TaxID=192814 RepID=UPI0015916568|nr:hypothetical protein [Halobacillus salinus]
MYIAKDRINAAVNPVTPATNPLITPSIKVPPANNPMKIPVGNAQLKDFISNPHACNDYLFPVWTFYNL